MNIPMKKKCYKPYSSIYLHQLAKIEQRDCLKKALDKLSHMRDSSKKVDACSACKEMLTLMPKIIEILESLI